MALGIFNSILIVLTMAFVVSMICHRLKIPIIIGYIVVGIVVGPHSLSWIPNVNVTRELAEFGVVFLLFTVGLEFSLEKLLSFKTTGIIYGVSQILIITILTTLIGIWIGMTAAGSIVVGGIVAMSSTAIVMKQLTSQKELGLQHSKSAIAILLLQDLAVIPFLILIPSLAAATDQSLTLQLLWALMKGVAAILLIFSLGRWILRPLFHRILASGSTEFFTLTTLLVTLGSAWFTHYLGLSLLPGAFMAGMMLGETEYKRQIETAILPFRDVLLGLFFITIGMQLDLSSVPATWIWIATLLTALIFLKTITVTFLGVALHHDKITALRSGLVLAQGSEFGFAILTIAMSYKLLPPAYGQVILTALLLSMLVSPLLIQFNERIAHFLLHRPKP